MGRRTLDSRKMRILCIVMLFNPVLFVFITILLSLARLPAHPPEWSNKARIAALVISAYMMLVPFLLNVLPRKSVEQLRARGIHFDALLALVGLAGSAWPMVCGVALVASGDRLGFLYVGLLLSVVGTAYWSWREREFLFRSVPPVVPTKDRQ